MKSKLIKDHREEIITIYTLLQAELQFSPQMQCLGLASFHMKYRFSKVTPVRLAQKLFSIPGVSDSLGCAVVIMESPSQNNNCRISNWECKFYSSSFSILFFLIYHLLLMLDKRYFLSFFITLCLPWSALFPQTVICPISFSLFLVHSDDFYLQISSHKAFCSPCRFLVVLNYLSNSNGLRKCCF